MQLEENTSGSMRERPLQVNSVQIQEMLFDELGIYITAWHIYYSMASDTSYSIYRPGNTASVHCIFEHLYIDLYR